MSDLAKYEQYRKEALARGAIEIGAPDSPSSGFDEEPLFTDLDPELEKRVSEAEDRAKNAKISEAIQEATAEARSENIDAGRKYRFRFQDDYDETKWTKGTVLWMGDFLCKLQTIRPDFFFAEYSYMGLRGLGCVVNGQPEYTGTACHEGQMPEWSLLKIDARGLPVRERYRGWRTVLLNLIKRGYITVEQSNSAFGEPIGPRAKPWLRGLYEIRNNRCGECRQQFCNCSDRWDYLRSDNHAYDVPPDVLAGRRQLVDTEPCRIIVP